MSNTSSPPRPRLDRDRLLQLGRPRPRPATSSSTTAASSASTPQLGPPSGRRAEGAAASSPAAPPGPPTQGLVHLVQRRNGPSDFSYLAIRRPRPRSRAAQEAPTARRRARARAGGGGMTADVAAIFRHLTQAELAERWRVSTRTLDRWREARQGTGLAEAERPGPLPDRGRARLRAGTPPPHLRRGGAGRNRRAPPTDSNDPQAASGRHVGVGAPTFGNAAPQAPRQRLPAAADRARREAPGAHALVDGADRSAAVEAWTQAVSPPRRRPAHRRAGRRRHRHPRPRPRAPRRPAGPRRGSATR